VPGIAAFSDGRCSGCAAVRIIGNLGLIDDQLLYDLKPIYNTYFRLR
jgi:hypothetical protein